jgi:hypothetical protein
MPTMPNINADSADKEYNQLLTELKNQEEETKLIQLNEQWWNLDVQLTNGHVALQITPHQIIQLVIENDLHEWPIKGYITINNPYEYLERTTNQYVDGSGIYLFRADARNRLKIKMNPTFEGDGIEEKFPSKIWTIEFDAVIYDTDDPQETNIGTKTKRLYFHDMRYQMMLEKNIQWSTADLIKNNKPISQLTNSERSVKTGIALKNLLIAAGFQKYIDIDNWDEGINTIFYTSPALYSVADDVQSILSNHISKDADKCILYYNRGINKLQLVPINKFFDKAGKEKDKPGELQIEHLFFEDSVGGEGEGVEPFKAPLTKGLYTDRDIKLKEYNRIVTYDFIDMAGIDNGNLICGKPVYWYDLQLKKFGVDMKDNSILEIKEKFQELYTNKLLRATETSHPLLTLNKLKTEHYNIKPQFTYAGTSGYDSKIKRSLIGAANVLFAGVFLNECIYMRLLGSTHRIAGTFVGIDRLNADSSSDLDKKLCGQWFVINVKHNIYYTKYVTDVIAVKVHAWDAIKNGTREDV